MKQLLRYLPCKEEARRCCDNPSVCNSCGLILGCVLAAIWGCWAEPKGYPCPGCYFGVFICRADTFLLPPTMLVGMWGRESWTWDASRLVSTGAGAAEFPLPGV